MDPIPVIDLNEYDLSYDIQFVSFMITLLDPYIYFVSNKSNNVMGLSLKTIQIFKKNGDPNNTLNINSDSQELNHGQFIEFIQHTFPDIITDQLKMNIELYREENIKYKIFRETYMENFNEYKYRFDDNMDEYTKYCKYFQKMNKEEIMNQMKYYDPTNYNLNFVKQKRKHSKCIKI